MFCHKSTNVAIIVIITLWQNTIHLLLQDCWLLFRHFFYWHVCTNWGDISILSFWYVDGQHLDHIIYTYQYLSSIPVYGQKFAICTYTYPAYLYTANNSLYVPIPFQHICIRPKICYMNLYLSSISVYGQQFAICTYTYPAYLYTANNSLNAKCTYTYPAYLYTANNSLYVPI